MFFWMHLWVINMIYIYGYGVVLGLWFFSGFLGAFLKGSPWSERVQFRVGSVFRVHLRVRRAQPNQGFTLE